MSSTPTNHEATMPPLAPASPVALVGQAACTDEGHDPNVPPPLHNSNSESIHENHNVLAPTLLFDEHQVEQERNRLIQLARNAKETAEAQKKKKRKTNSNHRNNDQQQAASSASLEDDPATSRESRKRTAADTDDPSPSKRRRVDQDDRDSSDDDDANSNSNNNNNLSPTTNRKKPPSKATLRKRKANATHKPKTVMLQNPDHWKAHFDQLVDHCARYGHCRVVPTEHNVELAHFCDKQRDLHAREKLQAVYRAQLDVLGFFEDEEPSSSSCAATTNHQAKWNDMYQRLQKYQAEHGHCNVPDKWKEDRPLALWVMNQRRRYHRNVMTAEQIQWLEDIGFRWRKVQKADNNANTNNWGEGPHDPLTKLRAYQAQHGHCNVPVRYHDRALSAWVCARRRAYKANQMPAEQIQLLTDMGFVWFPKGKPDTSTEPNPRAGKGRQRRVQFDEMLERLKAFQQVHGHMDVPQRLKGKAPKTPAELAAKQLGQFVHNIRCEYHRNEVSTDKQVALEAIGFTWRSTLPGAATPNHDWDEMIRQLHEFKNKFGHPNLSRKRDAAYKQLAIWCQSQKRKYNQDKLEPEKVQQLEEMGFAFGKRWDNMFAKLVDRKKKHKNVNVGNNTNDPEKLKLFRWLGEQRLAFHNNRLNQERLKKLQDIGVDLATDDEWKPKFEKLVAYKEKFGHCNVPSKYRADMTLARWVERQRASYHRKHLAPDKIAHLKSIGFDFTRLEEIWETMFQRLVEHTKKNNGDPNTGHKKDDELANWVKQQRHRYTHPQYPLKPDRIARLEEIGFKWRLKEIPAGGWEQYWFKMLDKLKEYRDTVGNGSCNVPQKWEQDPTLANWVNTQRLNFRKNKLSQDKIDKLDELGFEFSPGQKYWARKDKSGVKGLDAQGATSGEAENDKDSDHDKSPQRPSAALGPMEELKPAQMDSPAQLENPSLYAEL